MATPQQLLRKLDERFILGDIAPEQYHQMRARLQAEVDSASVAGTAAGDPVDATASASPSSAGGMEISDSVIKGNVTSGSASVGNININLSHAAASGSSAELEYEKCVMLALKSGGSLEIIRRELDDRRLQIGLPIRLARDIEVACLESCGRKPIRPLPQAPAGTAGPDPLTRFFKSASGSIASMFSGSGQGQRPSAPVGRPPPPVPASAQPAARSGSRPGVPPPVPKAAQPSPAAAGEPASPVTEQASSVKESVKEEISTALAEEQISTPVKEKTSEGQAPAPRKPPPLPRTPPPLQRPDRV